MECPKCGFERQANDIECSKCGILYEKYVAKKISEEESKRQHYTDNNMHKHQRKYIRGKVLALFGVILLAALLIVLKYSGYNPLATANANAKALGDLKRAKFAQSCCIADIKILNYTDDIDILMQHWIPPGTPWETYPNVVLSIISINNRDSWFIMQAYSTEGDKLYQLTMEMNDKVKITERDIEFNELGVPIPIGEEITIFHAKKEKK